MIRKLSTTALVLALSIAPLRAQNALPPVSTQLSKFFSGTQTILRIFPAVNSKTIYLTQLAISGTTGGVFTLSSGTGTNCGTSTTTLYTETLIAGTPISVGDGSGAVAVIGTGLDVCITIATQSLSGWVSIAQF